MLISIMLTSLGYLYAHRTLGLSLKKIGYSNYHSRFFLVLTSLMLISFTFWCFYPTYLWFCFGTLFVFIKILPNIFFWHLDRLTQKHRLRILDQLVLGVQSGHSLRATLSAVSTQEPSLLRVSLSDLLHAFNYETAAADLKSVTLKRLFEDLFRIEKSQTKCADQLRALRKRIKTMEDFRRKSGQVTLQIRMQAAVSAVLFAGLLGFIITQFGYRSHRGVILVATSLFIGGLVTVFVIGRRVQWTT